jgi:hypothetical protein
MTFQSLSYELLDKRTTIMFTASTASTVFLSTLTFLQLKEEEEAFGSVFVALILVCSLTAEKQVSISES